jgi:signal transduction histidine kinase
VLRPYIRQETASAAQQIQEPGLLKNAHVLILTDDSEFGRLLSSCWQAEQQAPSITTLNSGLWKVQDAEAFDLMVVGPVGQATLGKILSSLHPGVAVILCAPADFREMQQLRSRYPRLLHVALRDDWTQTLVLVAGEALRRIRAERQARQAISRAAQSEREAVLGRYMAEMKHSVNNALTSILGNAELLLLEPGQLSAQSLHQIKTMHSMTLRINEIMQRFSSLSSEMRDAEKASQAETEQLPESLPTRN